MWLTMPRARDGAMKRGRESHKKFGINPVHHQKMASAWLLKGHSADDGVALPVSPRQLVPGFRLELCDVLRTQHHVEVEVIERRRRRQIRLGGRHAVREHPASAG